VSISNNNSKNATLNIKTTAANGSTSTRTGKVNVNDDIGNEYVIQVIQGASEHYSNVTPQSISDISHNGDTKTVTLTAN
jgi:hypothetical protein